MGKYVNIDTVFNVFKKLEISTSLCIKKTYELLEVSGPISDFSTTLISNDNPTL